MLVPKRPVYRHKRARVLKIPAAKVAFAWQAIGDADVTATVKNVPSRRRLLEDTSEKRKQYPVTTGFLDYFPDACAAVAEVSFQGNEKHNPGQPLHHARGKSADHADCIARHLIERGGFDGKIRHTAALAWRAMALLQEEIENEYELPLPRGAKCAS